MPRLFSVKTVAEMLGLKESTIRAWLLRRRAAKSTRRIKFDRNKSVEADLTFWASFLGGGAETMNVGHLHMGDLLIDMTFLTVEVPEIGLPHEPEHKNRISA